VCRLALGLAIGAAGAGESLSAAECGRARLAYFGSSGWHGSRRSGREEDFEIYGLELVDAQAVGLYLSSSLECDRLLRT